MLHLTRFFSRNRSGWFSFLTPVFPWEDLRGVIGTARGWFLCWGAVVQVSSSLFLVIDLWFRSVPSGRSRWHRLGFVGYTSSWKRNRHVSPVTVEFLCWSCGRSPCMIAVFGMDNCPPKSFFTRVVKDVIFSTLHGTFFIKTESPTSYGWIIRTNVPARRFPTEVEMTNPKTIDTTPSPISRLLGET